MDKAEYRNRIEELRRRACALKCSGVRNRDIGPALALDAEQFRSLFKPDECPKDRRMCLAKPIAKARAARSSPVLSLTDMLKGRVASFQAKGPCVNKFSHEDVLRKFGQSPVCYLTGSPINWSDGKSYELDHVVPVAKGGTGEIENLGLCTPRANRMKADLDLSEFVAMCRRIAETDTSGIA